MNPIALFLVLLASVARPEAGQGSFAGSPEAGLATGVVKTISPQEGESGSVGPLARVSELAPARAGDLLLVAPERVESVCHAHPTELRDRVAAGGWTVFATDAGVLVDPPGGAPRVISSCDGLPSNRVTSVTLDGGRPGSFLVGMLGGGVVQLHLSERGAALAIHPLVGLPPRRVTAVSRGPEGVWIGTAEEGLWFWQGPRAATQPVRNLREGLVTAVSASPTNSGERVYVARGRRGLWAVEAGKPKARRVLRGRYVRRLEREHGVVRAIAPSAVCTVAESSSRRPRCEGPELEPEGAALPSLPPGPPSPHVTAMAVHQGELWVGTFQHGLATFDGSRWAPVDSSPAASILTYVNDLEVHSGSLWVASPHGAARHDAGGWHVLGTAEGLPGGHVNAILPDGDRVWLGTSHGVLRIDARGPVLFTTADGLPGPVVYDLAMGADGRLLVGTNRGAARWRRGRFEAWTHQAGELSDNWVNAVASWDGEVWLGTYDAGIDRRDRAGRLTPAPTPSPLWVNPGGLFPFDRALAVATLGDGLWVRATGGAWIARIAPRLVPDPDVTCVEAYGGQLWIGTRAGLASWRAESSR